MCDLPENMGDRYHSERVGAKHFGRYFWVKSRDLLPKCFALDRAMIPIGQGRSISADKLSVQTKDLLRKCFAPTDICW